MITVAQLRQKAENRYRHVLRSLIIGEEVFPLRIRLALPSTTAPLDEIRASYEAIRSQSKERLQHGYTVEWRRVATRRYAGNDVPESLAFSTSSDYLGYIGKTSDAERVLSNASLIAKAFQGTRPWCARNLALLEREQHVWTDALRVATCLRDHPFPGVFARQLPIPVPTKFVEQERGLLQALLEQVAPAALHIDGETFEERAGLLTKSSLIEVRFLSSDTCAAHPFRHFTASISELTAAGEAFTDVRNVLIVENHITFLTLPNLPDTLAIMGQGYAVHRLAALQWLATKRLFYWGDIDPDGFRILGGLRRYFPNVHSVMMDEASLAAWFDFVDAARSEPKLSDDALSLTIPERALLNHVTIMGLRLEQEKIPITSASKVLMEALNMPGPCLSRSKCCS